MPDHLNYLVSVFPNLCLTLDPNQLYVAAIPSHIEGRFANVTNAGRAAVDVRGAPDEGAVLRTAKPRGPDASVLASSRRISVGDGGKKADHRGDRGVSRKPLRRECRVIPV